MPRREIDYQPLDVPPGHGLQLFGNDPVVAALDEVLVDMLREGHEFVLRLFADLELCFRLEQLQHLPQSFLRQEVDRRCFLGHQKSKR